MDYSVKLFDFSFLNQTGYTCRGNFWITAYLEAFTPKNGFKAIQGQDLFGRIPLFCNHSIIQISGIKAPLYMTFVIYRHPWIQQKRLSSQVQRADSSFINWLLSSYMFHIINSQTACQAFTVFISHSTEKTAFQLYVQKRGKCWEISAMFKAISLTSVLPK